VSIATEPGVAGYVGFFKALGNPIRAQIVEFLLSGERCVCEMTGPLDVSQPLVSHHLALLRDAGLVGMRSEGTRTYYSIDWARFDASLSGFVAHVEHLRRSSAAPQIDPCEASERGTSHDAHARAAGR
jgi:DNA-binding transcriptional ArsR family regulator